MVKVKEMGLKRKALGRRDNIQKPMDEFEWT